MTTETFECTELADVRGMIQEADAHAAVVARFHDAAATAATEYERARGELRETLSAKAAAAFSSATNALADARAIAETLGDPIAYRERFLNVPELWRTLALGFERRCEKLEKVRAAARKILIRLETEAIEAGSDQTTPFQRGLLDVQRGHVSAIEHATREAQADSNRLKQRADWLAGGQGNNQPSELDRTRDAWMAILAAPLMDEAPAAVKREFAA
jgi:hypothetical protein